MRTFQGTAVRKGFADGVRGKLEAHRAKAQAAKVGRGVRARFDRLGGDDGSCG